MSEMSEQPIHPGLLRAVILQRDQAMNQSADLQCNLTIARARITELEKAAERAVPMRDVAE